MSMPSSAALSRSEPDAVVFRDRRGKLRARCLRTGRHVPIPQEIRSATDDGMSLGVMWQRLDSDGAIRALPYLLGDAEPPAPSLIADALAWLRDFVQ